MQIDNNFPSYPNQPEQKNRKTILIIKNPKVQEIASTNLKRHPQEIESEVSTKKIKLCTYQNENTDYQNLEAIFFAIKDITQQQDIDQPIENYKDAANQIFELKKKINIRELFTNISNDEKIKRMELLLKIIHPYPLSLEIFEREADIFRVIQSVCDVITPEVQSEKNKALKIKASVENAYYPLFTYDFATWASSFVSEEIEEMWKNYETDEGVQKQAHLEHVINLFRGEIQRFTFAKENNRKNEDIVFFCNQALATCYERLADTYFDGKSDFNDDKKIEILEEAIALYQKSKEINICSRKKSRELEYSILNVRYELAICLKEENKLKESIKQLQEIEKYTNKNFKTNKITPENYELVFYRLAVLFEQNIQGNNDKLRVEAIRLINKFYEDTFLSSDKTGKALDLLGWLKHFTTIFRCQTQVFAPESTEDYSMALNTLDRKNQLLEGLSKLKNNFSHKYGITLKNHQIDSYEKMTQHIQSRDDLCGGYLHLPTGAGKTYIMLLHILATRMPTLILVPRTALMNQTIDNIKKISPNTRVSRYDGHAKDIFSGQIMVTTYQMLERDFHSHQRIPLESFGLIWADEAHNALTAKQSEVIKQLQAKSFVVGLTATDYFNGKRPKDAYSNVEDLFRTKIHEVDLVTLIENGSLSSLKNVIVTPPPIGLKELSRLKKNKEGDYSEEDLKILLNKKKYNDTVSDIYLNEYDPETNEKIFGKPALVFCVGIDHAEAVTENLNESLSKINGNRTFAACIHSRMSAKKVEETIQLHKEGKICVLVGDKILTEGYDNPKDSVLFNLRPTRSVVLAQQRGGRVLRPDAEKKMALIFDWAYPEFGDQLLFHELVGNNRWVGIKEAPEEAISIEPRKTDGYSIDWSPQMPSKKAMPGFSFNPLSQSSTVQEMMVEEPATLSKYYLQNSPIQITKPVNSPINIFQTNVYQGQGFLPGVSTQQYGPFGYYNSPNPQKSWNYQNTYPTYPSNTYNQQAAAQKSVYAEKQPAFAYKEDKEEYFVENTPVETPLFSSNSDFLNNDPLFSSLDSNFLKGEDKVYDDTWDFL